MDFETTDKDGFKKELREFLVAGELSADDIKDIILTAGIYY